MEAEAREPRSQARFKRSARETNTTACVCLGCEKTPLSRDPRLSAGVKSAERPSQCDGGGATERAVCLLRNLVAGPAQVEVAGAMPHEVVMLDYHVDGLGIKPGCMARHVTSRR